MHSPIKRVRGLGATHEGTGHFWLQRVSALALVPLSIWLMIALVNHLLGTDRITVASWFHHPLTSLGMVTFIVALAVHARIGIQEIITDYVHGHGAKIALILLNNTAMLIFSLASLCAIARLHFIGI